MRSCMVLLLSLLFLVPSLLSAASFTCHAGDVGCLVASISKANTNGHQSNTIHLHAGTYSLDRVDNTSNEGANAFPVITAPLRLIGAGADQTLLLRADSAPLMRLFEVSTTGALRLEGVTLQGGEVDLRFFQRGGCIRSDGERLVLMDSVVRECAAWVGGGIDNRGTFIMRGGILTENLADFVGAALALRGPVTSPVVLTDCWIGDNVAQAEAGIAVDPSAGNVLIQGCQIHDNIGILNAGGGVGGLGTVTILDTVFLGNFGGVRGGAISLTDGTVTIRDSACLDNTAEHFGGCFDVQDADVDLTNTTITGNQAGPRGGGFGGGIYHTGDGRVTLTRTRLFGNQAATGPDCFGTVERGPRTLIGDASDCTVVDVRETEAAR